MVHSLPESYGGAIAVGTVDVDSATEVADEYSVSAIPHFVFIKGGVQASRVLCVGGVFFFFPLYARVIWWCLFFHFFFEKQTLVLSPVVPFVLLLFLTKYSWRELVSNVGHLAS